MFHKQPTQIYLIHPSHHKLFTIVHDLLLGISCFGAQIPRILVSISVLRNKRSKSIPPLQIPSGSRKRNSYEQEIGETDLKMAIQN